MLIKLMNNANQMILINPEDISIVRPYGDGLIIRFRDGDSKEVIPDITVEEFLVKTRETSNEFSKMATAICDRISHLEDAVAAGLQYVGRSCN